MNAGKNCKKEEYKQGDPYQQGPWKAFLFPPVPDTTSINMTGLPVTIHIFLLPHFVLSSCIVKLNAIFAN
uniref:Uncharacterized protein n=1 Tax=Pyxicephalus adspersus TaxID=30357 RepID=A0AAV3A0U0_PYXAD|nr:TPA: hypothetical protein GDO54_002726 [Pyxicephalus adspersus]